MKTLRGLLRNPWLHRLLGLIVGAVFAYAAHDKIWWPERFARIVYHYQVIGPSELLPALLPNLLAVTLPWIELLLGLALILGVWRREAALVSAVLLAVFIVAVGSTLARGIDIENCGCFSLDSGGRAAGIKLILEDLGLLIAALVITCLPPRPSAQHEGLPDPRSA
jgi:uncharacterized membrane protein YphA (DoxX/SURF4 family)